MISTILFILSFLGLCSAQTCDQDEWMNGMIGGGDSPWCFQAHEFPEYPAKNGQNGPCTSDVCKVYDEVESKEKCHDIILGSALCDDKWGFQYSENGGRCWPKGSDGTYSTAGENWWIGPIDRQSSCLDAATTTNQPTVCESTFEYEGGCGGDDGPGRPIEAILLSGPHTQDTCAMACSTYSWCHGFYVNKHSGDCYPVAEGCVQSGSTSWIYYLQGTCNTDDGTGDEYKFQLRGSAGSEMITILDGPDIIDYTLSNTWTEFTAYTSEIRIQFHNDDGGNRNVFFQSELEHRITEDSYWAMWRCDTPDEIARCDMIRRGELDWNGSYDIHFIDGATTTNQPDETTVQCPGFGFVCDCADDCMAGAENADLCSCPEAQTCCESSGNGATTTDEPTTMACDDTLTTSAGAFWPTEPKTPSDLGVILHTHTRERDGIPHAAFRVPVGLYTVLPGNWHVANGYVTWYCANHCNDLGSPGGCTPRDGGIMDWPDNAAEDGSFRQCLMDSVEMQGGEWAPLEDCQDIEGCVTYSADGATCDECAEGYTRGQWTMAGLCRKCACASTDADGNEECRCATCTAQGYCQSCIDGYDFDGSPQPHLERCTPAADAIKKAVVKRLFKIVPRMIERTKGNIRRVVKRMKRDMEGRVANFRQDEIDIITYIDQNVDIDEAIPFGRTMENIDRLNAFYRENGETRDHTHASLDAGQVKVLLRVASTKHQVGYKEDLNRQMNKIIDIRDDEGLDYGLTYGEQELESLTANRNIAAYQWLPFAYQQYFELQEKYRDDGTLRN